jgi:hypothetical protein
MGRMGSGGEMRWQINRTSLKYRWQKGIIDTD